MKTTAPALSAIVHRIRTHLRPALVLLVLFTALTGFVYPMAMAGIAQLAFPGSAHGSLIERNGKVVGSALIGQSFTAPIYFWPRPSATSAADPAVTSASLTS